MNTKMLMPFLAATMVLAGCQTTRPLDTKTQAFVRDFAPEAIASSTQFLRGAPISVVSASQFVLQGAGQNPQLEKMLAKAPKNLEQVFSNIQTQGSRLNTSAALQAISTKFGLKPQAGANCGPISTPVDADQDGIPSSFNYNFDCTTTYDNFSGASLTGRVVIQDANDSLDTSGYRMTITNLTWIYTNPSLGYAIGLRTNSDTQVSVGSGGKYTVNQNFKFEAEQYINGAIDSVEYSSNGSLDFTPPPNATNLNRFSSGTLNFRNAFNFKIDTDTDKFSSTLQIIGRSIQVDKFGCGTTKMVNSGSILFTDNTNTLTWTITGCGNGNWNYQ